MSISTALPTSTLVDSIGVNTHLDNLTSSYADTSLVTSELEYLGVEKVRDSMAAPMDAALFEQVAAATGVKFDVYLSISQLSYTRQIAEMESASNILVSVEGINEGDTALSAVTYGNLTGYAAIAAAQQLLYTDIKSDPVTENVPVIGPSYGVAASFGIATNTSAISDYGNTHEYWGTGNPPNTALFLNEAQTISGIDPLIATEAGYYTGSSTEGTIAAYENSGVDDTVQAKYDLTTLFVDWQAGISTTFLYELMDRASDPNNTNFEDHLGLFNADGTPKLAAVAIHNLISILSDTGTTPLTGILGYQITGLPTTAGSMLMEKSNGTFDLAVWNDVRLWSATSPAEVTNAIVPITINFGHYVQSVIEYDPLTGASAVMSWTDVSSISLSLLDHPVILQVTPYAAGVLSLTSFVLPETVASGLTTGQSTGNLQSQLIANATKTNPNLLQGLTLSSVGTANTLGVVTFNAAAQTLTYQAPAYNPFNPTDSFTYTLIDSDGHTVTGTVAITETAPANTTYAMVASTRYNAPPAKWTLVSEAAGQSLYGSSAGGDTLIGGSDTSMFASGTNNTVEAGNGNHTLGGGGNGARVILGNGNNTIGLSGSGNVVTTGNGNNVVWKSIGTTTITMGNGNQAITVGGLYNTISIGTGTSTISAGADGSAAGYENVTVAGGANSITVGGTHDTVVVLGGTGNNIVSLGGLATLQVNAGANVLQAQASGNQITSFAGINTINTNGNNNVIVDVAGIDTIWLGANGNKVTAGSGIDNVTIAGTGNTVVAGSGTLTVTEAGNNNTIVLSVAGNPVTQLYGNLLARADQFDLSTALTATNWDRQLSDIGNYLSVTTSGATSTISIDPDGTGPAQAVAIAVLYNTADLTLQTLLTNAALPSAPTAIVANKAGSIGVSTPADFTTDGKSDLVMQNSNGNMVIYTMDGLSIAGGVGLGGPGPSWHVVATADFNGDGHPDLLMQNDDGDIVDYLMNGTTITSGYNLGDAGSSWHVRGTADFNGDGNADILLQNDNGSMVVWNTNGQSVTDGAAVGVLPAGWAVEAVADFNGDGHPDLLAQSNDGSLVEYTMNGSTITGGAQLGNPGTGWSVAGTGDYNADGKADILLHSDAGQDVVWEMNGTAVVNKISVGYADPAYTNTVAGLDLNGDGSPDLVIENTTDSQLAAYTMNSNSTITAGAVLGAPGAGWNVVGSNPITFIDGTGSNLVLAGTPGPDQFNLTSYANGVHTISSFNPAQDTLALSKSAFPSYAAVQANEQAYQGGTFINLTPAAAIVIHDVTPSQLSASNFVLR